MLNLLASVAFWRKFVKEVVPCQGSPTGLVGMRGGTSILATRKVAKNAFRPTKTSVPGQGDDANVARLNAYGAPNKNPKVLGMLFTTERVLYL